MRTKSKLKVNITKVPLIITEKMLAKLYSKLLNIVTFQKALYKVNTDLGSSHEAHDYVQETLITLIEKYNKGKAVFYSDAQLWSYCLGVLEMRLMRQHRDYTIVKSRTCQRVDIDGEMASGTRIEDIASFINVDTLKDVDNVAYIESMKNYVIGFIGCNATVVPVSKIFTLDASNKVISLYTLLSAIDCVGVTNALQKFNIPKWEHYAVIEAITEFLNLKDPLMGYKATKPLKHVMSKREKFQIATYRQQTVNRPMLSLAELERAINV